MQGAPGVKGFRTVRANSEIQLVVHKSRFIGQCYPIESERCALEILERVRKRYWDATHNCFAYSVGENGQTARFSDDGEPSGTAGLPMMDAIRKIGVTNLLCVVTRYFGGVLLGAGGLVRVYSKSASESIRAAGCVEMRCCASYALTVPYPLWGRAETVLRELALLDGTEFMEAVRVSLSVPLEREAAFLKQLSDRMDGRLSPERRGEALRPFALESEDMKE